MAAIPTAAQLQPDARDSVDSTVTPHASCACTPLRCAANIHPNISGRWYLVFGTATKVRAFQYIPVREELVVDLSGQRIALESTVGPFSFFIKGVVSAWRPEERGLDFQFNAVEVRLGGKQVRTGDVHSLGGVHVSLSSHLLSVACL